MKKLFLVLFLYAHIAGAAVWQDPRTGMWIGNICTTAVGWQFVPPQLVGSACYAPGLRSYGFIANQ